MVIKTCIWKCCSKLSVAPECLLSWWVELEFHVTQINIWQEFFLEFPSGSLSFKFIVLFKLLDIFLELFWYSGLPISSSLSFLDLFVFTNFSSELGHIFWFSECLVIFLLNAGIIIYYIAEYPVLYYCARECWALFYQVVKSVASWLNPFQACFKFLKTFFWSLHFRDTLAIALRHDTSGLPPECSW